MVDTANKSVMANYCRLTISTLLSPQSASENTHWVRSETNFASLGFFFHASLFNICPQSTISRRVPTLPSNPTTSCPIPFRSSVRRAGGRPTLRLPVRALHSLLIDYRFFGRRDHGFLIAEDMSISFVYTLYFDPDPFPNSKSMLRTVN